MNAATCSPASAINFHPNRLFRLAESLFNESRPTAQSWTPLAEVSESDVGYAVKLDLPEVNSADVKVTVHENVLRISGERKPALASADPAAPNPKIHLQERNYGSFARSFSLPKNADPEQVSADYKNGVLTVNISKRAEVQPKEISVSVN
jgi:HSP20 family protein